MAASLQQLFDVSGWIKDVTIPLISAAVAAGGIALSILFVGRNEGKKLRIQRNREQENRLTDAVEEAYTNALVLRGIILRLGLENPSTVLTSGQLAILRSARQRFFQSLYTNHRVFAELVPSEFRRTGDNFSRM